MFASMMKILEFIRDRARYYNCPVCGRRLEGCDVRMLKAVEERFTVQVTCASCWVQFVVILAVEGEAVTSEPELVEQHRHAEAPATPAAAPIEADELLDVHLLLEEFRGPLPDLVRQPSGDRR
jgi:hypothetical protein